jgi:hypothetical protein
MALMDDAATAARLAGYSWGDIDNHVQDSTATALAQGYTQPEIDAHLGNQPPDDMHGRLVNNMLSSFSSAEAPLPEHAGVTSSALGTDTTAVESAPDHMRSAYASALLNNETTGPTDFAQGWASALNTALDFHGSALPDDHVAQVADNAAATLPGPKEFTDAAIAAAHESGTPPSVPLVRITKDNLVEHYAQTGELPLDYVKRNQDNMDEIARVTAIKPTTLADRLGLPVSLLTGAMSGEQWDAAQAALHGQDTARFTNAFRDVFAGHDTLLEGSPFWNGIAEGMLHPIDTMSATIMGLTSVAAGRIGATEADRDSIMRNTLALMAAFGADAPNVAKVGKAPPIAETLEHFQTGIHPTAAKIIAEAAPDMIQPIEAAAQAGEQLHPEAPDWAHALHEEATPEVNAEGATVPKEPITELPPEAQEQIAGEMTGRMLQDRSAGWFRALMTDESGNLGSLFHGTPHLFHEAPEEGKPFGEFKLSAVGTGEGTQAFGHGLYLAENKGIAEYYRDLGSQFKVGGNPFEDDNPLHHASYWIDDAGSREGAIQAVTNKMKEGYYSDYPLLAKTRDILESGQEIPKLENAGGHLYEVHLPEVKPEHFLEWDKPLSKQSPYVQAALEKAGHLAPEGKPPSEAISAGENPGQATQGINDRELTGKAFYKGLVEDRGDAATVSKELSDAGIAGTRYLDAIARGNKISYASETTDQQRQGLKIMNDMGLGGKTTKKDMQFDLQNHIEFFTKVQERADPGDQAEVANKIAALRSLDPKQLTHGDKTYNHVIFDPKNIKITGRDGEILPVASDNAAKPASLFSFMKTLASDQSGSLRGTTTEPSILERAWKTPAEFAAVVKNRADKAAAAADLQQLTGLSYRGNQAAWQQLHAHIKTVERFVPEYQEEIKGIRAAGGDILNRYDPITGNMRPRSPLGQLDDWMDHRFVGDEPPVPSALYPVVQSLRENGRWMRTEIERRGPQAVQDFIHYYLPRLHKDPDAFVRDFSGTGRSGSSQNLQRRSIPTNTEAIERGHEPLYPNTVERVLHYNQAMRAYLDQQNLIDRGKALNAVYLATGPRSPSDVQLQGRGATIATDISQTKAQAFRSLEIAEDPNINFEHTLSGIQEQADNGAFTQRLYASQGWGKIYNRYYNTGFGTWSPKAGDIYSKLLFASNASVAAKMGLSLWHFGDIVLESYSSGLSRLVGNVAYGEGRQALLNFVKLPAEPILRYLQGRKGQLEYLRTPSEREFQNMQNGANASYEERMAHTLASAGVRPLGRTEEYLLGRAKNLGRALSEGTYLRELREGFDRVEFGPKGAGSETRVKSYVLGAPRMAEMMAREAGRFLQSGTSILFDNFIPRVKYGSTLAEMSDFFRRNPGAPEEQALSHARLLQRSMDDRFGELVQDNLHWNRTLKQLLNLSLVSVGWEYGTVRAYGGAVNDIARGDIRSPRARWLAGFLAMTAIANTTVQKLMTTKWPWETDTPLQDTFVGGRTGGVTPEGKPERGQLPIYTKDPLQWWVQLKDAGTDPVKFLQGLGRIGGNKFNNFIDVFREMGRSKDLQTYIKKVTGDLYKPINLGDIGRLRGTNIPEWVQRAGLLRPTAPGIEDPERADRNNKINGLLQDRTDLSIERGRNRRLEEPDPAIESNNTEQLKEIAHQLRDLGFGVAPGGGGGGGRAGGSSGGGGGGRVDRHGNQVTSSGVTMLSGGEPREARAARLATRAAARGGPSTAPPQASVPRAVQRRTLITPAGP